MKRRQLITIIGTLPIVVACGSTLTLSGQSILATTSQIGDIVGHLIGDEVAYSTLIRTGLDPHTYKATASDLLRFNEARVVLYNGLNLEASLERVITQMPASIQVVSLSDAYVETDLIRHGNNHIDPHIWFDIALWRKAVRHIARVLSEVYPNSSVHIQNELVRYEDALHILEQDVQAQINTIPRERRILITAHDAFGYFGRAYGFEVLGIQGISTATEAGIQDMSALADIIVQREIPAIFVESTVSPKTIEALQYAVAARGGRVQLGGQLYSDSLGDPGTDAVTYIGMIRHNVKTIVTALQGVSS